MYRTPVDTVESISLNIKHKVFMGLKMDMC